MVTATIGGRAEPYLPVRLVVVNVWWIVTDEEFLRDDLALELFEGIHKNCAWLQIDGVTEAGSKLTEAFRRRNFPVPYTPPSPGSTGGDVSRRRTSWSCLRFPSCTSGWYRYLAKIGVWSGR